MKGFRNYVRYKKNINRFRTGGRFWRIIQSQSSKTIAAATGTVAGLFLAFPTGKINAKASRAWMYMTDSEYRAFYDRYGGNNADIFFVLKLHNIKQAFAWLSGAGIGAISYKLADWLCKKFNVK